MGDRFFLKFMHTHKYNAAYKSKGVFSLALQIPYHTMRFYSAIVFAVVAALASSVSAMPTEESAQCGSCTSDYQCRGCGEGWHGSTSIIASDMMQRSNGVPDVRHARKSREKKSRDSVEVVVRRGSGSIGPSCHCSIRSGVPWYSAKIRSYDSTKVSGSSFDVPLPIIRGGQVLDRVFFQANGLVPYMERPGTWTDHIYPVASILRT